MLYWVHWIDQQLLFCPPVNGSIVGGSNGLQGLKIIYIYIYFSPKLKTHKKKHKDDLHNIKIYQAANLLSYSWVHSKMHTAWLRSICQSLWIHARPPENTAAGGGRSRGMCQRLVFRVGFPHEILMKVWGIFRYFFFLRFMNLQIEWIHAGHVEFDVDQYCVVVECLRRTMWSVVSKHTFEIILDCRMYIDS